MDHHTMDHHLVAFHWDTDVGLFLFPGLNITGVPALLGLCGILVLVSILYEGIKVFQTNSKSKTARQRFRSVSSATETTNLLLLERNRLQANQAVNWNSKKFFNVLGQSLVFIFQNITGYMLMLSVMVYNVYVFMAIIFGLGLGYFLFGHKSMKINMENIRARTTITLCNERNIDRMRDGQRAGPSCRIPRRNNVPPDVKIRRCSGKRPAKSCRI